MKKIVLAVAAALATLTFTMARADVGADQAQMEAMQIDEPQIDTPTTEEAADTSPLARPILCGRWRPC